MSVVVEQMASSPARSSHGAAREAPAAAVTAAALAAALGLALGPCAGEVQAAGLDAAAAHTVGDFLRPMLTLFTFLFIVRIPMTWYPELDINAFPWNAAYGPTEPVLSATRKVVPLVGGVDITPIIWVGLLSFFSEILLGPQGLLVLIERQGGL